MKEFLQSGFVCVQLVFGLLTHAIPITRNLVHGLTVFTT